LLSPPQGDTTSLTAASDRRGSARKPVAWIVAAVALLAAGFTILAILRLSTSSTASRNSEPRVSPTSGSSSDSELDSDTIESRVNAWNAAHASRDDLAFARLYADSVLYYGSQQARDACVSSKRVFLSKNPDFRQDVIGVIRAQEQGDHGRADFLKRVLFHGKFTDYPSYLVFKKSGAGWQIVTEGDAVTDANLAKRAAKATDAKQNAITGDFDGDGVPESLWLVPPRLPEKQTEENFGECVGKCDCRLAFSNSKLPPITVESCIGGGPVNEGDLDGDGADEIGLLPGWWHGCWRGYKVYTFKGAAWKFLVDPISTHCNQWDAGVDVIAKDPNRPGYVTIHYTDMSGADFGVKAKSVKVK
jgi:hypothetical protein